MKPTRQSERVLLDHVRECIERIREYTGGAQDTFLQTPMVQDAVLRNLQTLAESSQRLSATTKATEPGIPWADLAGFRNVLAHGYLGIDLEVVWNVVERDLADLLAAVERMHRFIEGDGA